MQQHAAPSHRDGLMADTESKGRLSLGRRVCRTLGASLVVSLGLLSFPSIATWMVSGWLLWHTICVVRGRPGFAMLFACFGILVAKQFAWTPALVLLLVVLLGVGIVRGHYSIRARKPPRLAWLGTACLWLAWGFFAHEWNQVSMCNRAIEAWDPERPVLCLGDSLTSGLIPDPGYPGQLKTMIDAQVINVGHSGITVDQGDRRLRRGLSHNPQVVVIELGGHDFMRGHTRRSTKASLQKLIGACRKEGAEVVLFEIPRGFIFDPFRGLERELAYENDLELVPDTVIRNLVIWSPATPLDTWFKDWRLSDDGIHSNARGGEFMAAYVAAALERMYGESCRK